ncbi:BapA/Bap/LapF family large adhesin [Sphingomonas jatrophae]|uniref:BapA prefix-like domain-containing protein n=1 Tax=Sphingomonas jatrophae TaxID=1166337 RepID=A0A1I6JB29_9SPHN|nr:BapA/Bap/LapF family large adhesin [Sphingomonas jatrophae]SFR76225.1 hypothetical protein SAMN05192580_0055 [Sphingomonas jatrophae]
MNVEVIDKATGNATQVSLDSIDLQSPSVVRLNIDRTQISALERQGDDLIVRMADGTQVRLADFYQTQNGVGSDLVVQEPGNSLWLAHPDAVGAGRFTLIEDLDNLLAGAAAAGGGSSLALPILLGAVAAGGVALAAGGGGGGGDREPEVDRTPPAAPTATVNANGTTISGTGEAGATVTVTNGNGATIGTGTVGANGSYSVSVSPAQANGGTIRVVQTDPAGNASPVTTVTAPDITAPAAPTATIAANGASVSGTGEAGATVTIRNGAGAVVGTAVVAADGTYSVPLTTPQTNGGSLTVTQADPAGNVSPATSVTAPDSTAPAAPTATVAANGTTVTGTGEPGATVSVRDASGAVIGTAPVAANGSYTVTLTTPQANGGNLTVTQSDPAGNASPATTVSAPDITAPAAPTLAINATGTGATGTGEPGATVTITSPAGAVIGTATVAADGSYAATLTPAQVNGEQLTARQSDIAGNASGAATAVAPDLTAPAAPTATLDAAGSVVTGTGEAGATVTVRDTNGAVLGSGVADAQGAFSITLATPQVNGEALSVTQADAAGNVSPATALTAPDLTAPAAPVAAVDQATGATLTGTGEAGATITVTDAFGDIVGTGTVAADGTFSVTLSPPQIDGEQLSVRQTDGAGNISAPATAVAPDLIPSDGIAPAAPAASVTADGTAITGTAEAGATVRAFNADGSFIGSTVAAGDGSYSIALTPPRINSEALSVTQTQPDGDVSPATTAIAPDLTAPAAPTAAIDTTGAVVSGTGEAGATVTVRDGAGTVIGSGPVDANGNYSITLATPRTNGETLSVTQADAAGNVSPAATTTAPDTTAPLAPSATIAADGTGVTGTGEAGATVTVRAADGTVLGTATVAADGSYTAPLSPAPVNGEALSVTQTDSANNGSPATSLTAPDLTAPAAPVATIAADGTSVTGTGEAGALIEVRNAAGVLLGSETAAADGSFTVPLSPAQANGGTVSVVQTDAAGNPSPATTLPAPDTTAPLAPVATVTADGTAVTGTGEAGATVTVTGPGGTVGTGTVGSDGSFTVPLSPAQANGGTLTVVQTDGGGNASPATSVVAPDITAPAAPVATVAADGTSVSGTGEPGARVTVITAGGAIVGTAIIAGDGTYSAPISPAQNNGGSLSVTQTDAAGNTSPAAVAPAPDITAPAAPAVTIAADGSSVTGTGEPGAAVSVTSGGTVIGTGTVGADGSFTVPLSPAQANGGTVSVTQTDTAGNLSPAATVAAPDITAPAAPTITVNGAGTIVSGTGEPGATVTITAPGGAVIGTATVIADGSYTTTINPPQTNGELLRATQSDAAGNASGAATTLAPDFTAPAAPTAAINATGTSVTGTGEPGATLRIANAAGTVVGSTTVAADGSYTVTLTPAQANGEALTATQSDLGGNTSPGIPLTAPDITPPAAPVATLDATGSIVSGTGEVGATVTVRGTGGALLGTAVVNPQGAYSVVLSTPQVNSQVLAVTQADGASNVSAATSLTAPDLTAPAAPTATVEPTAGATLTGTGEAGATITVTDPLGVVIGTTVVTPDGSYSVTLNPPQTDGELLTVRQTDPSGNVSPPVTAPAPDLVPDTDPLAPTAAVSADGTAVTGVAEANATVRVLDATGTVIGTTVALDDGSYSVALTPPRINGETLRVTQTDGDGDISPPATAVAPDLTAPAAPTATIDATGSIVTGTGEAGATVTIRDAANTVLGTATVAANGAYSATLTPPQTNGQPLTALQADATGNPSPATAITAPDLTAPVAPAATVSADGTTVTGTGEAGATVTVRAADGTVLGSAPVAGDGSYTVTLTPAQANGGTVSVTQADATGNVSPATTAPAPDITPPAIPAAAVSGDGTTVVGTGEPGATISVTGAGGVPLGTGTVAANGSYSVTLTTPQANGGTVQVIQTDAAGNDSAPATATAPDITAPTAPTATIAANGTSVTGTGEAGATIQVRNAAGTVIGTALVAGDGSYTAPLVPAQANGGALTVTQADAAGNVSPTVPLAAPDITPPAAPTIAVAANGTFATGTGEPGALITITGAGGTVLGTATVAANGSYTATLTPAQTNGEVLTAGQADAAGNASPTATANAPDLTAPAAPVAAVNANGTAVTGTGEPGATVTVTNAAGAILGSGTVAANGTYTVALSPAQANGQTFGVVQADAAGNDSPSTPVTAPDITAPATPTAAINADGSVVTGRGEPGATITIRDAGGTAVGTATVAADGSYTAPLTPPQVNGEALTATQADPAGNPSPAVPLTAPDLTAPAAPVATVNANGSAVTGTGEPGATVTVSNAAGTVLGTATVAANGSYTAAIAPAQVNGEALSVVQADAAGNASPATSTLAPDVTAPAAPTLAISADGTTATGTGEAGATVTITDPAGNPIGTAVVAPDGSYTAPLTTPQVNGELVSATQEDMAGNPSSAATATAPDLVVPAAPTATVNADGTAVTGTGEPGASIVITDPAGNPIGTATVAANGSYTAPLDPAQRNGEVLGATQTDPAGNVSPPVSTTAPDLTAPAAPAGTVSADGTSLTGTGEPGASISITDPDGTVIGTATVAANGSFTAPLNPVQVNGELLGIAQRDGAGNLSPTASATAPDLTAPAAPTATIAGDGASITGTGEPGATISVTGPAGGLGTTTVAADGSYTVALTPAQRNGEALTVSQADPAGNPSPTVPVTAPDLTAPAAPVATVSADGTSVSGTGEPGALITVTNAAGTPIGTTTVGTDGSFTAPISPAQANGELVSVRQADGAGNTSPTSIVQAPDITPPAAPTLAISANGATATGTGEPGATVTITASGGAVIGSAVVAANGTYAATLTPPQDDGETLTATQRDAANNVSPAVTAVAPDGTAPLVPTASVTADGTAVVGTGVAGNTITVTAPGGAVIGTATVAADGSYTATLTTPQRNGEVLGVTQADTAGNASPAIPVVAPDITAPAAPTAAVGPDGTTVTGTGEAGATVTITTAAGAVLGTALVGANGGYSATLTTPQANGETLTAIQRDAAGNPSAPTNAVAPDITAPAAPTGLAVTNDGTSLTGTGEAGTTVEVRNGAGTLVGSGTVGAGGGFTVGLVPPQAAGGTLDVTLRDGAGNQSAPGSVAAPFDVVAQPNTDTAGIDLVPFTAPVNFGTANYLALVSLGLVDLDAQVLGIPNVQFTVLPGHSLDAVFTYDAVANIGVASGYSVVVQQLVNGQWVAAEGPGDVSLLQLGLLNGNLTARETFEPGTYRAFLTFQGAAGVGLLGTLSVAGTDSDFTDVASVVPQATDGNVITDAGPGGVVDFVSPQTRVASVTVNGVTTAVAADDTVVQGAWGRLVIDRDGTYTYTPNADAAAIGKTDVFTYTLLDPADGELESATLSIAIGSPDVTGAPLAANDAAVARVTYQNVVTNVAPTTEFSFNTALGLPIAPRTGSGSDSFVVASNTTSDITITATRGGNLSILPNYTLSVRNAANVEVARITETALATLPLAPAVATFRLDDLPAGTYTYSVSSTNILGTAYGTTVAISESITFANQYSVASTTAAQGDLLANDTANTSFATIRVDTGNGFAEVGNSPLTVVGDHGTLTVSEAGGYIYQPLANLPYSTTDLLDTFTYQLVQPNGTISTATLTVTIDVPADGTLPTATAFVADPASSGAESDVVVLDALVATPDASVSADLSAGQLAYDLFEGQGDLETVLSRYLADQGDTAPAAEPSAAPANDTAPDIAALPEPSDPLSYLVMPDDQDRYGQAANPVG